MPALFEKFFDPYFHAGEQPVVPLFEYGDSMTKVASSLDHVPELQKYVNQAKPEDGWYTLLIHANGTDEVWGPNKKGDSFPAQWLKPEDPNAQFGYKTFSTNGIGYVHHRNTPEHWTGRILLAEFSDPMGRAELIAKFNIARLNEEGAPYFVDMLEKGLLPAVSMGCRVPYDVCSICGNKAPTVAQYCDCLRTQRLSTMADGRRVRMFNVEPVFHDISLVSSPADPAARVLLKVAEDAKLSEMDKKVPADTVGGLRKLNKRQYAATLSTAHADNLSLPTLLLASKIASHPAYSAFTAAGILLRPYEFAAIEYARRGEMSKAAEVFKSRTTFPLYESRSKVAFVWTDPDQGLMDTLRSSIRERSVYLPQLERRIEAVGTDKVASVEIPDTANKVSVSDDIQVAYAGYRKVAEDLLSSGKAGDWVRSRPAILAEVLGHEVPMLLKFASLDKPEEVFGDVVRGAFITSNL